MADQSPFGSCSLGLGFKNLESISTLRKKSK
jgi:hypothetical protein